MELQRLHSRLSGFPQWWVTVESLALVCLLRVVVLHAKLALSVVILLHSLLRLPHRCLHQVRQHSVALQQHRGMQVCAHQALERSVARRLFYQQVVRLMVKRYFDRVDLTTFLGVVILAGRFVVIAALVVPAGSADTEEMRKKQGPLRMHAEY